MKYEEVEVGRMYRWGSVVLKVRDKTSMNHWYIIFLDDPINTKGLIMVHAKELSPLTKIEKELYEEA